MMRRTEERLVYSSEGQKDLRKDKPESQWKVSKGPLKVRLESKGRGGKEVTVLFNLPFSEDEAKEIRSELAQKFACGSALKNQSIELRGDFCERVMAWAAAKGIACVRAGA